MDAQQCMAVANIYDSSISIFIVGLEFLPRFYRSTMPSGDRVGDAFQLSHLNALIKFSFF